ncbi:MAG: cation:dicarboxylase symporter family transporter [Pseudomonadota bacterium]
MFRQMPFILVAIIFAVVFLAPVTPLVFKQVLYSTSLSIKELLSFLLPIIIFSLLFKTVVTLSHNATKILGIIIVFVCISNFLSTFLSHYVGAWIYTFDLSMIAPNSSSELQGLWTLTLPQLIANNHAMLAGIVLGLIASKLFPTFSSKIANQMSSFVDKLLRGFLCCIPLFVAGFVVKLEYDNVIRMILKDYTAIFMFVALAQIIYISFAYLVLSGFQWKGFISSLKNMIPAGISGFSTMSSAASMPLTIIGVENNVQNKELARSVVPVTINIHLIGDCIAIPIFAYAVLKSFGMAEPSLMNYLIFTFYFVVAKFSVAAVPGGGIIVMLPILEKHLGFDGKMASLITALYILFDPIITSANVLGNGAFAKMIDKIIPSQKKSISN